jgi:hypothetical protein
VTKGASPGACLLFGVAGNTFYKVRVNNAFALWRCSQCSIHASDSMTFFAPLLELANSSIAPLAILATRCMY